MKLNARPTFCGFAFVDRRLNDTSTPHFVSQVRVRLWGWCKCLPIGYLQPTLRLSAPKHQKPEVLPVALKKSCRKCWSPADTDWESFVPNRKWVVVFPRCLPQMLGWYRCTRCRRFCGLHFPHWVNKCGCTRLWLGWGKQ